MGAGSTSRQVSGFRPDVARPRTLLRRLFVEADALTLVELFKSSGFNRAAVEEPFLTAIIADEAEAAISHQTFDCSVRHVQNPPCVAPATHRQANQVLFREENHRRKPDRPFNAPVAG